MKLWDVRIHGLFEDTDVDRRTQFSVWIAFAQLPAINTCRVIDQSLGRSRRHGRLHLDVELSAMLVGGSNVEH